MSNKRIAKKEIAQKKKEQAYIQKIQFKYNKLMTAYQDMDEVEQKIFREKLQDKLAILLAERKDVKNKLRSLCYSPKRRLLSEENRDKIECTGMVSGAATALVAAFVLKSIDNGGQHLDVAYIFGGSIAAIISAMLGYLVGEKIADMYQDKTISNVFANIEYKLNSKKNDKLEIEQIILEKTIQELERM